MIDGTPDPLGGDADPEADHPVLVRFGQHVRNLRLQAGLTQQELAVKSGLHWTYISQVECGKRNITYKCLIELAAGLGTTMSVVVDGQRYDRDPGPVSDWDRPPFLSS